MFRPRRPAPGTSAGHLEPTLSASEIGAYAFCPRAWYLQRLGVPVDHELAARRRRGSRAHRRLGRRTTLLLLTELARRLLLLAIVLLAVLLVGRLVGLPLP